MFSVLAKGNKNYYLESFPLVQFSEVVCILEHAKK